MAEFVIDFPTLGDLIDQWVRQHCKVPDGFARGRDYEYADWQFWIVANHYRVRKDAKWVPERPLRNQAFQYRRSLIVGAQKLGKGPLAATIVANEAVGPSLFAGWAKKGDTYECSAHGCSCGWYYPYEKGEPKGMRQPSPLIQLTAFSEDQVDNTYRPLRAMVALGPLKELLLVREGFMRVVGQNDDPELDRIDAVTSSANSRVGNPISFALQDETGLWTTANKMRRVADAQRRGAAGMGGRTLETTNAWDPAEESVAQTTYEAAAEDVFKFYRNPDLALRDSNGRPLRYRNKAHRRRIHEYVYDGSWWVDLDSIEAEAAELMERDPAQAERFFGNRIVHGAGAWLKAGLWDGAYAGAS